VRKLYESYANPLTRVVFGAPISWDTNVAATIRPSRIQLAEWSPCNRFIAITWEDARVVDVLDSATLQRLHTLELSLSRPTMDKALAFSPDSHILTCSGQFNFTSSEVHIVSWDLQTGGIVSTIRHQPRSPVYGGKALLYSANGEMVGLSFNGGKNRIGPLPIFNVASGLHMHTHSFGSTKILKIWTQGEFLQFATPDRTTIAIWEVGFTSDALPTKVMALPISHDPAKSWQWQLAQPLYNSSRLITSKSGSVQIWDPQDSKLLLDDNTGNIIYPYLSPDGHFFASSRTWLEVDLWKESPTGYTLHKVLQCVGHSMLHFSQDSKSIVVITGHRMQLWHTEGPITPPLTQAPQHSGTPLLDFSPDGTVAVVARQGDNTVVVLDLRSGVLQLTIDVGVKVFGFRVIGNQVFVIGGQTVVSWNLPTSNSIQNARVTLKDSSHTMDLIHCRSVSISPNLHLFALLHGINSLSIYNASTGRSLCDHSRGDVVWFSPDGCSVWCAEDSVKVSVWRVTDKLHWSGQFRIGIDHLPEGCPWGSSCGYQVTNDWWILGPGGKRLLMLPPPWQSYPTRRVWKGQFLGLLHREPPEAIILDLNP